MAGEIGLTDSFEQKEVWKNTLHEALHLRLSFGDHEDPTRP